MEKNRDPYNLNPGMLIPVMTCVAIIAVSAISRGLDEIGPLGLGPGAA